MVLNFKNVIEKYGVDLKNVIHVGGHHGHEVSLYKETNPECKVILFEPHPDTFKIMCDNVKKYDDVRCLNVALGGPETSSGVMYTEVANGGQSNSLLKPALHASQYPHIVFNSTVEVYVHTLDSYQLDETFNFLSMDVQGYELEVLKGATKTLNHVDAIIAEINNAELYTGCCMVNELDEFLEKYGFVRVESDWIGGTWGDGLYIKNKS